MSGLRSRPGSVSYINRSSRKMEKYWIAICNVYSFNILIGILRDILTQRRLN